MSRKNSIFTIRLRKGSCHPQIILDADRIYFMSSNITHSQKHGHVNNIGLESLLDLRNKRKSYVEKGKIITDYKFNYTKALIILPLSEHDILVLTEYVTKKEEKEAALIDEQCIVSCFRNYYSIA